jgi:hypothetical protein
VFAVLHTNEKHMPWQLEHLSHHLSQAHTENPKTDMYKCQCHIIAFNFQLHFPYQRFRAVTGSGSCAQFIFTVMHCESETLQRDKAIWVSTSHVISIQILITPALRKVCT